MSTTADAVIALLKQAKGPGDVARALLKDPMLSVGLLVILALIYLFGRIYLWPSINPFKVQWISNLYDWATSPPKPTAQETYPYAKVIYPTYR